MPRKKENKEEEGSVAAPALVESLHLHKDQEQEIQYVKVANILPSPTNPRRDIQEGPIAELGDSIRKYGVIQPVTLRLKRGMAGKYELVCGERRWLASQKVERETIPAIIRDLNDDEVLDLQFTENLQRQDVHPMDEAVTFKAMIDTGRYTIPDIAAKVLKTEPFVAHRISLNSLIAEFQKDFWADKFLIGHAILFSRLTEADQQQLFKFWGKRGDYASLSDTKQYIDNHINRKLSSAPFKKDDADLVSSAGACLSCPKRSGANGVLFADYTNDDRCFDKTCFEKKMDAFLIKKVQTTLEEKPDIILVEHGYHGTKVLPAIKKIVEAFKVKILNYATSEVQSYSQSGYKAAKALYVSGTEAGQVKTVYIKGKEKEVAKDGKPAKRTAVDIDKDISAIEDRQARALELNGEKVWEEVEKLLEDPATLKNIPWDSTDPSQDEKNAMAWALLNEIDEDEYQEKAWKILKLKGDHPGYLEIEEAERIGKVTTAQLFGLLRLFALASLQGGSSHLESDGPFMLMPVLKSPNYLSAEIREIEDARKEDVEKRIANANKRIETLKKEKAALTAPKEKVAKQSPGKKNASGKKLIDLTDTELDELGGDDDNDE